MSEARQKARRTISPGLWVSGCLLALGLVYVGSALTLPFGSLKKPGEGFMPVILSVVFVILALAQFLGVLPRRGDGNRNNRDATPSGSGLWVVVTCLVLFPFACSYLTFEFCAFALIVVIARLLNANWREAGILALCVVVSMCFVFRTWLQVSLP